MKIWLASTAGGVENKPEQVKRLPFRLLSYFHLARKELCTDIVFKTIIGEMKHEGIPRRTR